MRTHYVGMDVHQASTSMAVNERGVAPFATSLIRRGLRPT